MKETQSSADSDSNSKILNIKLWMDHSVLRHTFYRKDISSKYLLHALYRAKSKMTSILIEGMTRLGHIGASTPTKEKNKVLGQSLNGLRMVYHSPILRFDIINAILKMEGEQ